MKRGGIKHAGSPFSRQLRAWMALAEIGDEELANRLGVSTMTISRWKNNINIPTQDRIPALAEALNVAESTIANLLYGAKLLPPDVQALANLLAELPAAQRDVVVAELSKMLSGGGRKHIEQKVTLSPIPVAQ